MGLALVVGLAGSAGAVARYLLDGAVQDRTSGSFPYGTWTVNIVGSLILGIVGAVALRHAGTADLKAIAGSGFCGGLTTWSTASWETVRLIEARNTRTAVRFTFANLAASLLAAGVGLVLFAR